MHIQVNAKKKTDGERLYIEIRCSFLENHIESFVLQKLEFENFFENFTRGIVNEYGKYFYYYKKL